MPVMGWAAGLTVRASIERYDHWIAFGLLAFVGINMIREAFKMEEDARQKQDPTRGLTLVMLSVATSIDALAVGLTISMLQVSIWFPALVIGLVVLFLGLVAAVACLLPAWRAARYRPVEAITKT